MENLHRLIEGARERVANAIKGLLVMHNERIGHRFCADILKSAQATYGEEIVPTVSAQLGWIHFVEIKLEFAVSLVF